MLRGRKRSLREASHDRLRRNAAERETEGVAQVEAAPRQVSRIVADYFSTVKSADAAASVPAPTDGVAPARCLEHDWPPPEQRTGRPLPPRSECPACRERSERNRRPHVSVRDADERLELSQPGRQPTSLEDRKWAEHRERLEATGELLPGSPLEEAAVEYMDARRDEEERPLRSVASQKIEGGKIVAFMHPRPRRRRRVAPWRDTHTAVVHADDEFERMRRLEQMRAR
jgi:hypothetical protein